MWLYTEAVGSAYSQGVTNGAVELPLLDRIVVDEVALVERKEATLERLVSRSALLEGADLEGLFDVEGEPALRFRRHRSPLLLLHASLSGMGVVWLDITSAMITYPTLVGLRKLHVRHCNTGYRLMMVIRRAKRSKSRAVYYMYSDRPGRHVHVHTAHNIFVILFANGILINSMHRGDSDTARN